MAIGTLPAVVRSPPVGSGASAPGTRATARGKRGGIPGACRAAFYPTERLLASGRGSELGMDLAAGPPDGVVTSMTSLV